MMWLCRRSYQPKYPLYRLGASLVSSLTKSISHQARSYVLPNISIPTSHWSSSRPSRSPLSTLTPSTTASTSSTSAPTTNPHFFAIQLSSHPLSKYDLPKTQDASEAANTTAHVDVMPVPTLVIHESPTLPFQAMMPANVICSLLDTSEPGGRVLRGAKSYGTHSKFLSMCLLYVPGKSWRWIARDG